MKKKPTTVNITNCKSKHPLPAQAMTAAKTANYDNWTKDDLISEVNALRATIEERVAKKHAELDERFKSAHDEMKKDFDERLRKSRKAFREFNKLAAEEQLELVDVLMKANSDVRPWFSFGKRVVMFKGKDVTALLDNLDSFEVTYHYPRLKAAIQGKRVDF